MYETVVKEVKMNTENDRKSLKFLVELWDEIKDKFSKHYGKQMDEAIEDPNFGMIFHNIYVDLILVAALVGHSEGLVDFANYVGQAMEEFFDPRNERSPPNDEPLDNNTQ